MAGTRQEYESGETAEARFVKGQYGCYRIPMRIILFCGEDLDRIEMALQGDYYHEVILSTHPKTFAASEYEDRHNKHLQSFFDTSISNIAHPEVKSWAADLMAERSSRGSAS